VTVRICDDQGAQALTGACHRCRPLLDALATVATADLPGVVAFWQGALELREPVTAGW